MDRSTDMPEIDTSDFELFLSESQGEQFLQDRHAFINLLRRLIAELGLQDRIEHLKVCGPARGRAELYREPGNQWPSERLGLDIYTDRYMDERLLRHELRHEADRWDAEMLYDPDIEEQWRKKPQKQRDCFEMAANISVDARLGRRGLGKQFRRDSFRSIFGNEHESVFEEAWADPPKTWSEIEEFAIKLSAPPRHDPCGREPRS
jgi:hypothetical protein